MDIRPILSSLSRHKTAAGLIVLEIAFTCAIVCNALFLIGQRVDELNEPSGIAEDTLLQIQLSGLSRSTDADARTAADLAILRALPGVAAATTGNQVPFFNSSSNSGIGLVPNQERGTVNTAQYTGERLVDVLGLRIVAGRDFTPDEYRLSSEVDRQLAEDPDGIASATIITRSMAEKMFPGESAIGKVLYNGSIPLTVVGVIDTLARPNIWGAEADVGVSLLLPLRIPFDQGNYFIRVDDPSRRTELLDAAVDALMQADRSRLVATQRTYEEIREHYFRSDRAMVGLLAVVIVALLVVTALGIVGLASFWVQQRTKQVGVRRALGATRGQILRYFQLENFLLATAGIVLGMLLAYAINQLLMQRYELPRLPLYYLPIGAVALWLLGQVAVLGPARAAAAVPPAVATRSV